MLSEVRGRRLGELRKRRDDADGRGRDARHHPRARFGHREGAISRSEVETLAAYVAALGGQLKLVADSATTPWFWAEVASTQHTWSLVLPDNTNQSSLNTLDLYAEKVLLHQQTCAFWWD